MARRYEHVSLLTDYGTADEFVGVVHAVIVDIAPHARITDLTHGIAPFDVRAGSLALVRSIGYVPEGVVAAVVDPGVGTERRAVAIEVGEGAGVLVGPDNGLLAPAVALAGGAGRAVVLDRELGRGRGDQPAVHDVHPHGAQGVPRGLGEHRTRRSGVPRHQIGRAHV